MLVNGRWFDGSTSLLEAHRRVRAVAGPNAVWVPTYEPVSFPEHDYIYRLLQVLHRHRLCRFLTGIFTVYSRPTTFLSLSLNIRGSDVRPTTGFLVPEDDHPTR